MASEKRPIDAEELWKKFESEPWYDNADRDEIALQMVLDAPTMDVVEVVHGRWIDAREYCGDYMCSNCDALYGTNKFNYCPNCGAKMDLKE